MYCVAALASLLSIILYAGKDLSLPLRLLSFSAGISLRQEVEHFSAEENQELNPFCNERFHSTFFED